jgi:phosphoglycerate dehydrogenase-like enzyme
VRVLTQMGGGIADALAAIDPSVEVVVVPLEGDVADVPDADVLVASHKSAAILDLARKVPWVQVFGTGVDGLPGEIYDGRVVTCARGAGAVPISEFVLATMLAFEKQLPDTWIHEPPRHWGWTQLGGLAGRTVGIVGMGGIGRAVAVRALAFGCDVVGLRRRAGPSPVDGARMAPSLADLLPEADHLVIAAPATAATRHLVDAAALERVKPGVHLVNIARGTLVDQDALRVALDDGRVAVASLDVVEPEPLPAGHWLYDHPKVRLSAHVSWSSPWLTERMVSQVCDNIRARMAGTPLPELFGVVDPAAGY